MSDGSAAKRGERNNNPGNLERDGTSWAGMAEDQSRDDRFIVFQTPYFGIRALARILLSYQRKHGLTTIRQIIPRWAPSSENDTKAYVLDVCLHSQYGADETLDLSDPATLADLVEAIIYHENGEQPYSDALVDQAVESALA